MTSICYLCGLPIRGAHPSGDHVVPATLISRSQPKVRGFDYAGKIPTHAECNNEFGPETYVRKALDLLVLLHSDDGKTVYKHRDHPDIEFQALDASKLSRFTVRDLAFFKIIDMREEDYGKWMDPGFFDNKSKTNASRDALLVALSVLAKSAAALLIKRHLTTVPNLWRIYAGAYVGDARKLDFDSLLGATVPFDTDLKVWIRPMDFANEYLVIYRTGNLLVYFFFLLSSRHEPPEIRQFFSDADIYCFIGSSFKDLLNNGWQKI